MGYRLNDRYYYSGAIHIHTTESDGTKTIEEVVAIGQEVKLDFMMFTDHMTLTNREAGKEGYYGQTLVVVGYEHNDLQDNHHYLIFKSPKVYDSEMTAAEYVTAGADDNALGIMAHPDEIRDPDSRHRPYPWKDWSVERFNGLELWNQMSEWMEKLTPLNKLAMAFSPRKSMVGPTDRIMKKWDELNQVRKVSGIASVDAHAFPIRVWPGTVEIFPYKVHFRCLRTYLILDRPLSDDFETARSQLYGAIRDCRLFFANIRWGNPKGFEFSVNNSTVRVMAGETIDLDNQTKLIVSLPKAGTIKIVGNGQLLAETKAENMEYTVTRPGVYRVEVWRKKRGWIFSNHIRVGL